MATLVTDKIIVGISDIRDESDRDGIRIIIELKKDAYPKKVLNRLFQTTELQTTFHVNLLALIDGLQPRVLNLKSMLEEYLKHRTEVIRRRTEFDLEKNRDKENRRRTLSKDKKFRGKIHRNGRKAKKKKSGHIIQRTTAKSVSRVL